MLLNVFGHLTTLVFLNIWPGPYATANIMLFQTVKGVCDAVPFMDTDMDERLLIHISYSPRR